MCCFFFPGTGGYDNGVGKKKKHNNPSESERWAGGQSAGVIDLRCGDTHGSSAPHTCVILMGGPAAGHPHV